MIAHLARNAHRGARSRQSAPSLVLILIGVVTAVLQSSVVSGLIIFGVSPDLPLVIGVCWLLVNGTEEGVLFAIAAGLALDAMSGAPFGLLTMAMVSALALVGVTYRNVYGGAWYMPYLACFGAALVYNSVFALLARLAGYPIQWWPVTTLTVLPSALVDLALMPIVFWAVQSIWPRRVAFVVSDQ